MAEYALTLNMDQTPGLADGSWVFSSEEDARTAQNLAVYLGFTNSKVTKYLPELNYWAPDDADAYILGHLVSSELRIVAIKFIRSKSRAGLKESKDWLDKHFPPITKEPSPDYKCKEERVQTLGQLLRSKRTYDN